MKVERVGGTIWNGYALANVRHPIVRGPVVVDWDLKALRMLLGEVALGLRVEGAAFRVDGTGHWGIWGKGLKHLNGDVQATMLDQALREFSVTAEGVLKVQDVSVNLSGDHITLAQGLISWSGGQVTAPGRGSRNPIDFPAVNGLVTESEGNLLLTVTETKNNQMLGELGLMPAKGLGSVKVLQRVLTLAGINSGGNDNKMLVNMQQPLPF